jgi:septal ring factor EnvC (AmiA/AmiB activator)
MLTLPRTFTDVFKTPGKLRGKTPRTARKRDALEQRQPLTDVFAPNAQAGPTPVKTTTFYEKVTQFQIAEDGENAISQQRPLSRSKSPQRIGKPGNTDSGYHGMTEDEMDLNTQTDADTVPSQSLEMHTIPMREDQSPPRRLKDSAYENEPASDESFMSAKEAVSHNASKEQLYPNLDEDNATVPDEDLDILDAEAEIIESEEIETEPTEQELHAEMSHEPSETSSPAQPLARKSSFTFSSLPAREPLTAKRSIGGRNSHMDAMNRNSVFAKSVGKSFGVTLDDDDQDSPEKESQNKTSAQLLHERISMLGKAKETRSSKSIPQAFYPQLPQNDAEDEVVAVDAPAIPPKDTSAIDDEDDDWIAPSKPTQQKKALQSKDELTAQAPTSTRPTMHKKAISTTDIPSPMRPTLQSTSHHSKSQSVIIPNTAQDLHSTTPAGSPASKKQMEPMSASKKLWGAFKSARSLFASSAGSSAAAKLEAHDSPSGKRSKKGDAAEAKKADMVKMPGALWSETQLSQDSSRPMSAISHSPSRKTRSSTESDKKQRKEMKAQQKAADEFEKAREKERAKANKAQEERLRAEQAEMERAEQERKAQEEAAAEAAKADERPRTAEEEKDREDMPPPPPPKSLLPPGKLRAPTRPVRPTREAAATKAKPAPVNIRVASQLQRLGQPASQDSFTSTSSSGSRQDGQAPPPPPKTGLRPASAQSNPRSSTMPQNNSRVRALEAAARKKEQEEREKQRKAEQKRELERKRAAKAEEDRRIEQEKKAEEQRKMQEMKQAAQRQAEKQAVEAKRREQQRFEQQQQRLEQQRLEQQRLEQSAAAKAKAAHELAEAIQRERAEKQALPRGDAPGTLRQLGQRTVPDLSARQIQPNPAKPPKRIFSQEDDEPVSQPSRPGMQRNPTSYQQNDAKRRKTDEFEQDTDPRHSVMAPPKRPSTMRKVSSPGSLPTCPTLTLIRKLLPRLLTATHMLRHQLRITQAACSRAR